MSEERSFLVKVRTTASNWLYDEIGRAIGMIRGVVCTTKVSDKLDKCPLVPQVGFELKEEEKQEPVEEDLVSLYKIIMDFKITNGQLLTMLENERVMVPKSFVKYAFPQPLSGEEPE